MENTERFRYEKYIFYTYEGYTVAPNENLLDSMQILGFEEANTYEEALKVLLKNNTWIIRNGFDMDKILHHVVV